MGIPGVLKEVGRGDRVALAKLAVEHLERTQRPLRIAIDAAIWNFQTQAGQGGKNPALRTLYYRLLRLLALPIHPLFVYDGKNKPLSKRGQTVSRYGTCLANETSRKLIQQFRFPCHTAPGEAEAECALLQKQGVVDMVMSQDGDAIMFGSRKTLRNWSKEGARGNKEPTHVDVLDLEQIKTGPGLDPDGMILVALLSGGDYDQQGLPGFGAHVASDIARAGFAPDLLEAIKNKDDDALRDWRERLEYELETNESGYFKKRHKTLKIPTTFPDRRIVSYYTDPAVSEPDALSTLKRSWEAEWKASINVQSLRAYAADVFDWQYKPGAWKLVRTLSRPLLADRLQNGMANHLISSAEQIRDRRQHYTMGGINELRISVVPREIVGLDLDAEEDSPDYLAKLGEDNEVDDLEDNHDEPPTASQSPSKPMRQTWNPYVPEKMWMPETLVELGAGAVLEEWNEIQRQKAELRRPKPARNAKASRPVKETDRIDRYFGIAKTQSTSSAPKPLLQNPVSAAAAEKEVTTTKTIHTPTKRPIRRARANSDASPDLSKYFKPRKTVPLVSTLSFDQAGTKHARDSPTSSPSRDDVGLLESQTVSFSGSVDNPIALTSSPTILPTSSMTIELTPRTPGKQVSCSASSVMSSGVRELEAWVTPRSTRRVRKKLERAKTEGAAPEVDSQPIGELLLPLDTERSGNTTTNSFFSQALPKNPGTGLRLGFNRSKISAVPRESLEGAWKELDMDEGIVSSKSRRRTRISCVDLTVG